MCLALWRWVVFMLMRLVVAAVWRRVWYALDYVFAHSVVGSVLVGFK